MIEIAPATALLLYLLSALIFLFLIALFRNIQAKPSLRLLPTHTLHICEYCQFAYLDAEKNITQCPRCQAFNRNN